MVRDADRQSYAREERGGWILGIYEVGAPARFEYGVPDSFRADLFPLDLDRIAEQYMAMTERVPSCAESGLKDDFNGPICYTPDGNPLVGPAPGLQKHVARRGLLLRHHGSRRHRLLPRPDDGRPAKPKSTWRPWTPNATATWMTTEYAARKNEECYNHVYILHHPDEEREACRPLRTAPAYDRQKALGAQFGQVNGWERPNYYGPLDAPSKLSTTKPALSGAAAGGNTPSDEAEGDPGTARA